MVGQEVGELLVGVGLEGGGFPQVRRDEAVGVAEGLEGGLDEVPLGPGVSGGAREDVLDAREGHDLLHRERPHDRGSAGRRDEANHNGAALAGDLHRHGVGETELVAPVAAAHRDQIQLGRDDGTADSRGDLLTDLDFGDFGMVERDRCGDVLMR